MVSILITYMFFFVVISKQYDKTIYTVRHYNLPRDDLTYIIECTQVIYKYYTILYKGLEHAQTLYL